VERQAQRAGKAAKRAAEDARLSKERAARAAADAPVVNPLADWAEYLRQSDRPGLDGIDVSPAVLAAEAERDGGTMKRRPRDQWDHLSIETDARPDPEKFARSEAINARIDVLCSDGTRRKKHEPAPPTLAARVTDPELMMASVRAMRGLDKPRLSETTPPPTRRGHKPQQIAVARSVDEVARIGA